MPADPARLAVARQLLDQLGLSPTDLLSDGDHLTIPPTVPTVAEYLPRVVAAAGPGARRAYGSYWTKMAAAWGERPLTAIAASNENSQPQLWPGVLAATAATPAST